MPGQVTASKLRERDLTIHWRRFTEPIAREHKSMPSSDDWTAHDQAANRRQHQQVNQRLSLRADTGARNTVAELVAVHGPSSVNARSITAMPRSAASAGTPSWERRRALAVRNRGAVSA